MTPTEFREIRDRLGLTQAELSEATGMAKRSIANAEARPLERGSLPTLMHLLDQHPDLVAEARAFNQRDD